MMDYEFFTHEELECKCGCKKAFMDAEFMKNLVALRRDLAFGFVITSGYRCPAHNRAVGGHPKSAHMQGRAVDIQATGLKALALVTEAVEYHFNGVGVSQKGIHGRRFIHLDNTHDEATIWSY